MLFAIDPTNGLAIYDQIVRQIVFAVAGEILQPGELVPSVRELARQLAVNPNTVARAYRQLQADDVLVQVRGTGLQVTAKAPKRCRQARVTLVRARVRTVLLEAKQSQLSQEEIQTLMDEELARLDDKEHS
jgi:GntR family transcriptional regulator